MSEREVAAFGSRHRLPAKGATLLQSVDSQLFPFVTDVRVLGFPNIEIKGQPQKNFQADFIKLMLEHKGDSTRERKSLPDARAGSAWLLLGAGDKVLGKGWVFENRRLFESGGLALPVTLPGNHVHACAVGQDGRLRITTPGRSYSGQSLINCTCRRVVLTSVWK